jgi:large subunit ribosomal protein L29
MKASQLREMSRDELVTEESALRQQLFRLRFQAATGQLESASKMKSVRRDIARIMTVLKQLESEEKAGK